MLMDSTFYSPQQSLALKKFSFEWATQQFLISSQSSPDQKLKL